MKKKRSKRVNNERDSEAQRILRAASLLCPVPDPTHDHAQVATWLHALFSKGYSVEFPRMPDATFALSIWAHDDEPTTFSGKTQAEVLARCVLFGMSGMEREH